MVETCQDMPIDSTQLETFFEMAFAEQRNSARHLRMNLMHAGIFMYQIYVEFKRSYPQQWEAATAFMDRLARFSSYYKTVMTGTHLKFYNPASASATSQVGLGGNPLLVGAAG